jgi:HEAT repeat protein
MAILSSSPSELVLAAVHRYLAKMEPEDTIPKLISALSHESPTLRAKIDETVLPVVITEQGEKRNQS